MRVDGLTEENKGKCEAGEHVFAEIGQNSDGGQAGTHLREREGGVVRDEREVAHDCEAEAEPESVSLDLRDTN